MTETEKIVMRLALSGVPFAANDNIADHLQPGDMEAIQREVETHAQAMLRALIIDVDDDHNTKGTAKRVAKMFCQEIYRGRYEKAPTLTAFPNVKNMHDLYMTGPISVRSSCSHHMCPILGKAWVAVIPGDQVIGLSKFNRLLDWICARPQIQEEMVMQVADAIEAAAKPKGLAVVIKATHTCMTWRGVREHSEAQMTTSSMRGAFIEKHEARAEFMALVNGERA